MNQPEFNRLAEIDGLFSDLKKGLEKVFDKYGVDYSMKDTLQKYSIDLDSFIANQDYRACDDGLDFTLSCDGQASIPYELRIDQELK